MHPQSRPNQSRPKLSKAPLSLIARRVRSRQAKRRDRHLRFETLEDRRLLAVDWRNPTNPLDVSDDGLISPIDPLQVINELNRTGSYSLPTLRGAGKPYWDVNGDRVIAPVDALIVINALIANQTVPYSLGEGPQIASERSITITVGPAAGSQAAGTRTYRLQVTPTFVTSNTPSSSQDLFAIYLVDPQQPGETLLDRGTPGTALFTLSATGAEFAPGRVRWDGEVVEIDLSEVNDRDTAELRLQMLNGDGHRGSRVLLRPLSNVFDEDGIAGPMLLDTAVPNSAGAAFNLTNLPALDDVAVRVENVRYNSATQRYAAELRLQNQGDNLARSVAVAFPGLPSGVRLRNPSGTTAADEPYINFAPAIASGGLGKSARSERLLVEFDNPEGLLFTISPQIFAGANQPPTLSAIAPLTVMPGGKLSTQLIATDPDGDAVTFSLAATGSTSASSLNLPTSILRGNGTLEFTPSPDQLGQYTFDVIASDGALDARRTVTLDVVADPNTTTRVSGFILDIDKSPLAGLQVEIGGVQGLTLADGSFTLDLGTGPVVGDTLKVRGETFPGPLVYPFIAEKLPFILEHDVFLGANNVITRPIFLPPLDVAGGTTIDPMQNTMVQQEVAPGEMAEVFVAAGTLMNQQSTPFNGTLSITEVPPDLTPAALPEGLMADLVVTIQPGEMVFATPAPLTLPNRSGWAPGTLMDLWSISPVTGEFEIVGTGRVSNDGSVVETIEGGIRNSSWHAFLLQLINTVVTVDEPPCHICTPNYPAMSDVNIHSGGITESHDIVTYASQGRSRSVNLVYNSLRADTRPIVQFMSTLQCVAVPQLGQAPQRLVAELSAERENTTSFLSSGFWNLPSCSGSSTISRGGALIADMSGLASGQYKFRLKTGVLTGNAGGATAGSLITTSQRVTVVNLASSSLGSGWAIAGVQEVIENVDGSLLLIDGGGLILQFEPPSAAGQPYVSPPGDFSRMEKLGEGTFRRTLKDQTVYQFNADNKLASERDRNGNTTEYRYAEGRLTDIVDPVQLTTHFEYDGGLLTSVEDPFGRVTRFAHDPDGNLTRITDPDGAVTSWEYDDKHHTVSMTDPNGNRGEDVFDAAGRVTEVKFPDGSTASVAPLQSRSVAIGDRNTSWQTAVEPITERVAT